MAVAGAIAASAVVGAYSASQSAKASKQAGQAGIEASLAAGQVEHAEYLQSREDLAPWRTGGEQALYMLQDIYGVPREIRSPESQKATYSADMERYNADMAKYNTQLQAYEQGGQITNAERQAIDDFDPRDASYGTPPLVESGMAKMNLPRPTEPTAPDAPTEMTERVPFEKTPGYLFRQQEGLDAIQKSAAARGLLRSGGTLESIQQYGQGLASEEFSNYTNQLNSMAGLGQVATQNTAALGAAAAGAQGQALLGAGQARASGYLGQAAATNQFAQTAQQGLGLYAGMQSGQQVQQPSYGLSPYASGTGGYGAGSSLGLL